MSYFERPLLESSDIRNILANKLERKEFTSVNREGSMTSLVGATTIEIIGSSFIADEDALFGEVNWDWVKREEEWYNSTSRNVNDIPSPVPAVWKAVADKKGFINSNYGWMIYSSENVCTNDDAYACSNVFDLSSKGLKANQYNFALDELRRNPESRRAIMIYQRPSMWLDYNENGRSDFCCTNAVQYLIRDGELHAVVQMRSNDAIFGYKGDRSWQQHVLEKLAAELNVPAGKLYWNVGSLHVYARHYFLVHHFAETGETSITKEEYVNLYPDSPYI